MDVCTKQLNFIIFLISKEIALLTILDYIMEIICSYPLIFYIEVIFACLLFVVDTSSYQL